MMHPADSGLVVVCGASTAVTEYVVEHGLDPARVVSPMRELYSIPLTVEQVVILDGWEPDDREVEWFWAYVACRMWTAEDSAALIERARPIAGLLPEEIR